MLLTTVYCGHMQNNYQGKATVTFNDKTLGTETLNVPFAYITTQGADGKMGNAGKAYVQVNDHVNKVTSDYMMYYDVTSLVKSGDNKALVHTEPTDEKFDGRVKLITLIVAYNDGSGKKIWYQVNRGHDADTYYADDAGTNYIGDTTFQSALPSDAILTSAKLTDLHMASTDGAYIFNGKTLTSGTPQGTYCGSDSWDVKDSFKSTGTNTLTYDRTAAFYKNALAILTAEYTSSSSNGGSTSTNNGGTSSNNGSTSTNNGSTSTNNGSTSTNNGSTSTNNGGTSTNNGGTSTNNGSTATNNGSTTTNNGSTATNNGQKVSADLGVKDFKVLHNNQVKIWEKIKNSVMVNVTNNGPNNAGEFTVELYADGTLVESKPVTSLTNGATQLVELTWKPDGAKNYTLKASVVPGSTISDTVSTNNELSITQQVQHNGYVGDKPLETYAHGIVDGNIIYDYGNSVYSGKVLGGSSYTVTHNLTLPANATIKLARLYNFWTWSATGTTGVYPNMKLQFQEKSLTPDKEYTDQKGWGSIYDYPSGTWAYDVTDLVKESGTYTTTVTNANSDTSNFVCFDGIGLLVVYEDGSGKDTEYWINEGCDMVNTMSTSGSLTPEDATVTIPFNGSIPLTNVESAKLWTTVQSGGHSGIGLRFNEMNVSGAYDSTPYSDLDIDEARPVETHLTSNDNTAQIIPPSITDNSGDYFAPSSAILTVTYKEGTTNDVTNSTNGTTSDNGSTNNNATPNDNGSTNNNATPNDNGSTNNNATTSTNGTSSGNGSCAKVSLTVNIIPAICLQVTPSSVDFGTVKPGTPSESIPLTLKNNGNGSIKVTAEVDDQANGPFNKGLTLDQNKCCAYSKVITSNASATSKVQLDLPEDYSSSGQFNGSLILWAEAAK
jgi:hypothetical protein